MHKSFSDILPNTDLFHVLRTWLSIILTVNRRSLRTTCLIYSSLTSVLPIKCLPLLAPTCLSLNLLFHTYAWHDVISIHSLKHFKCLWRSFRKLDRKKLVYLFVIAHSWMTWKKMQWFQKVKIIFIYSQDMMLDDNTFPLSPIAPTAHLAPLIFDR